MDLDNRIIPPQALIRLFSMTSSGQLYLFGTNGDFQHVFMTLWSNFQVHLKQH